MIVSELVFMDLQTKKNVRFLTENLFREKIFNMYKHSNSNTVVA
jgi:hypothetical protein